MLCGNTGTTAVYSVSTVVGIKIPGARLSTGVLIKLSVGATVLNTRIGIQQVLRKIKFNYMKKSYMWVHMTSFTGGAEVPLPTELRQQTSG